METPAGFTLIKRGHGPANPTEGFTALVTHRGINFAGAEVQNNKAIGRADVAVNGESFAIRRHKDGEYSMGHKGNLISSSRLARVLNPGRYVGQENGDWWMFLPVTK